MWISRGVFGSRPERSFTRRPVLGTPPRIRAPARNPRLARDMQKDRMSSCGSTWSSEECCNIYMPHQKGGATMTLSRAASVLFFATALSLSHPASAQDAPTGPTPPRLGFIDGDVSFWRPGAEDWAPAQVNTPLAEGDEVYAADGANVELQVGPRAFVRAGGDTQIGLETLDADTMQYEINGGHAAFDVKRMPPGQTLEVDTPKAAFRIERPGYYRVDVDDRRTVFGVRRGGRANATGENG